MVIEAHGVDSFALARDRLVVTECGAMHLEAVKVLSIDSATLAGYALAEFIVNGLGERVILDSNTATSIGPSIHIKIPPRLEEGAGDNVNVAADGVDEETL